MTLGLSFQKVATNEKKRKKDDCYQAQSSTRSTATSSPKPPLHLINSPSERIHIFVSPSLARSTLYPRTRTPTYTRRHCRSEPGGPREALALPVFRHARQEKPALGDARQIRWGARQEVDCRPAPTTRPGDLRRGRAPGIVRGLDPRQDGGGPRGHEALGKNKKRFSKVSFF